MAGAPYAVLGECQKRRADTATRARRRDIQRGDAVSVHFYPADGSPFHGHPHLMFPHRPRHAIGCPSRGPSLGLFPRHRWYSQRENGTTPYACECFLVSGLGTPNLHQVATTWHDESRDVGHLGSGFTLMITEESAHSISYLPALSVVVLLFVQAPEGEPAGATPPRGLLRGERATTTRVSGAVR